jgi:hypothetical protein
LTLKDPTLLIEGVSLFYQGYPLVNSGLSSSSLGPLLRLANIHDLFERTSSDEEIILEYFYSKYSLSPSVSDLLDFEHFNSVLESKKA